ncbi:MAG: DUF2764 family protein [Spirochaetales bacterium]|nr:DUF2764 family protein [Spirochaetales bacterium]
MGKAYYYTSATLPMLFYDNALPVKREDFLEICSRTLKESDFQAVEACTITVDEEAELSGFAGRYRAWEIALRNALVKVRAKEQGLDEREFQRDGGDGFGVDDIASSAIKIDSPLEAEHFLNKARWSYVDEMVSGHIMDLEFLQGYYLQLQIMERKESFQEEQGFQNYRKLYEEILSVRNESADNEVTE